MVLTMNYAIYGGAHLGGGYNGISPKQIINGQKTAEDAAFRKVLTKSWNGVGAVGLAQGADKVYGCATSPFRAVDNSGDFLARYQYVCGGPNQIGSYRPGCYIRSSLQGFINKCDGTGVEGASCNPRYVHDSSDYVKFKKLRAINQNFNDNSNGGYTNSSYVAIRGQANGNRKVAP